MCGREAWRSQPAASGTPDPTGPAKWVGTVAQSRALAGGRGRAQGQVSRALLCTRPGQTLGPGGSPSPHCQPLSTPGLRGETEAQSGGGAHSSSPMGPVLQVGAGDQAVGIPTCLAPARPSSIPAPPPGQTITPLLPLTQQRQAPPRAPPHRVNAAHGWSILACWGPGPLPPPLCCSPVDKGSSQRALINSLQSPFATIRASERM